jgi:precorrin-6B methylase 1
MKDLSGEHLAYIWAEQRLTSSYTHFRLDVESLEDPTRDAVWNRFSIAISSMETACALLSASIEAVKAMSIVADDREMSAWLLQANKNRNACLELYRKMANHVAPKIETTLEQEDNSPDEP